MQEIQTNTELPVLPSEDERFCISGYRCCMSNQTSVFSHVGKITFSRKQCSPSFPVTVLEVIAVKEQMGNVIGWVNAQVLETTDFNQKMTTDFNQYKCHRIQPISKMQ